MLRAGFILLLMALALAAVSVASAAQTALTLKHNPFNKPQTLATPPPKVERKKEPPVADVLPRLRAILISDSLPMVIADDEMLSPGKEINGYRLLSVNKRSAVFEKLGKKYTLVLEDDKPEDDFSR